MNKIDFFIVHLFNDYSGSPRVLRDALDALPENDGDRFVFTSSHSGFLDGVNAKRVNIIYFRSDNRYLQLCYYLLSQLHLMLALFYFLLKSALKGHRRTLLVNTLLPFGAGIAGKLMASKTIYYIHESHISPVLLKRFLRTVVDFCASHVIFVSNYLLQSESLNRPYQKVVHNGLRSDFPVNPLIDLKRKHARKEIIFAGSLKDYKGIGELLALAKISADFSFIAALNCTEIELASFIHSHCIPPNLTLMARPENLEELFASSFAVLNLSLPEQWVETFGLSLLEGMTFGAPAIAPPVGGPTEFVDKTNGLLIDSRETEAISDFLNLLADDFSTWERYSVNAQKSAAHFSSYSFKLAISQYMSQQNLL
ncbi:glycosyltransferase [Corallincola luteus]|uniref:Glycosyltransferase n=1 Tax=Corallincola luteus TaxID=1775177 RepID=A0ABY2AQY6_9GAMM|nr:glycosyltransferase family 4 protein [Corallincola luteus]TCI05432.1 glycosyltransferase [Corallincola luteus]